MKNIRFEDWEAEQLRNPEFREIAEDLEPGHQVARLRIKQGLTQAQLAEKVGTHQSSIARLESGRVVPRVSFLRKVVVALGGVVQIKIYSHEDIAVTNSFFVKSPQKAGAYKKVDDRTSAGMKYIQVDK